MNSSRTAIVWLLLVVMSCLLPESVCAGERDWPMWRCDAQRTAASRAELPSELHLLWKRELPAPRPAFPHDNRLRFDLSYEPVVMGQTMFVPSMVTDTVTALDTQTGREKWTFFADGPVRLAPVAWRGRVYFVSDDGYLYCLDAATGTLRWRFTPIPERLRGQKVLGHERLVSRWPARGGPVLADGTIYFGVGIFPFEGVWVCAVDAETGQPVWINDDCALIAEANQDHGGAWDAGLSPQGYLTIVGDKLAVANGRALPAFFDLRTGKMAPYSAGWGGRTGLAKGSWYVASIGKYFFQSGDLYGPLPDLPEPRLPAGGYLSLAELARLTGAPVEAVERWVRDLGIAVLERDGERCVPLRNWAASHLYWTGSGARRERERAFQNAWPRLQIDPTNDRRSV
ncbi:MAG: PQQ-binding-like beta-propeller repeat protein, partial [Planctomycetes bacterium]|nr:PQQ-binding-like beta-propeller repeat protein [Planctomycetota bacterium]